MAENSKNITGRKKVPLYLLPMVGKIWEAMVLRHGGERHGWFNWREPSKPISLKEHLGAIERHLAALEDGQWCDDDSTFPHLAHIKATAGIILDAEAHGCLEFDMMEAEDGKGPELLKRLSNAS